MGGHPYDGASAEVYLLYEHLIGQCVAWLLHYFVIILGPCCSSIIQSHDKQVKSLLPMS